MSAHSPIDPPTPLESLPFSHALKEALEEGNPRNVVDVASKHYKSTKVATMAFPPYSGAPLLGFFVPHPEGYTLLNAFVTVYFPDDEYPTPAITEYFDGASLLAAAAEPLTEVHPDLANFLHYLSTHGARYQEPRPSPPKVPKL